MASISQARGQPPANIADHPQFRTHRPLPQYVELSRLDDEWGGVLMFDHRGAPIDHHQAESILRQLTAGYRRVTPETIARWTAEAARDHGDD